MCECNIQSHTHIHYTYTYIFLIRIAIKCSKLKLLQTFHVANIGDSGFIIIRGGAVFQQSSPMVHEFNFPVHIERGDDPSKLIEVCHMKLHLQPNFIMMNSSRFQKHESTISILPYERCLKNAVILLLQLPFVCLQTP